MNVDHVQTVNVNATSVTSVTSVAITTTTGNLVVLGGSINRSTSTDTLSVSDSKTNTWTQNPSSPVNVGGASPLAQVCQFYSSLTSGGSGHTFSLTSGIGGRDLQLFVSEFVGPVSSGVQDQSSGNSDTSTKTPTSGATPNRNQAQEILVAHFSADEGTNLQSISPGAAAFKIPSNGSISSNSVACPGAVEYQITSLEGTDAGTFVNGASAPCATVIGTYKTPLPPIPTDDFHKFPRPVLRDVRGGFYP